LFRQSFSMFYTLGRQARDPTTSLAVAPASQMKMNSTGGILITN